MAGDRAESGDSPVGALLERLVLFVKGRQIPGHAAAHRNFRNELGREISAGVEIGASADGFCRLYLYGPDSGIDSYCTRFELANIYSALREVFGDEPSYDEKLAEIGVAHG